MINKTIHVAVLCVLLGVGMFLIAQTPSQAESRVQATADYYNTVTGRLVLSDGETPVVDVGVHLYCIDMPDFDFNYEGIALAIGGSGGSIRTDENGNFSVYSSIWSCSDYLMLEVRNPGISDVDPEYNVRPEEFVIGQAGLNGKDYNLGDVLFKEPNIHGRAFSDNGQTGAGGLAVHMDLISNTDPGEREDAVTTETGDFYLYRENPGEYAVRIYDYLIPHFNADNLLFEETVTVGSGMNEVGNFTTAVETTYTDDVFVEDAEPELDVSTIVGNVDRTKVSKDTVGLNVHWALGGSTATDDSFSERLQESNTKWAREHFMTSVRIDESAAWKLRYNQVVNDYRDLDMHLVGVLALDFNPDRENVQPNLDDWRQYVTDVVGFYKDYIKVWEVWNEPDLEKYLDPNTVANYVPILKTAHEAIKAVDPNALVLAAPLSGPHSASFMEGVYQQASDYFDEPALHVYYCDDYLADGQLNELQSDFSQFLAVVNKYRPSDNIWITEIGCSVHSGVTEQQQSDYLQAAVPYLLSTNRVEKIFIFNIIDRTTGDINEDNFGLLKTDFSAKPAWDWYKTFSAGTSGTGSDASTPVASGTSFMAYASTLRGGYQVASGNVMGDGKTEIIAGTGDGMGPHVQVFDAKGNRKSQFFAYDPSLRNGVTVSACDVNGDGYDEIVTAQGPGGWPVVKIFSGDGTVLSDGFSVLDGKYLGGIHLSCGDTNGDDVMEIVLAARQGGGPQVMVYNLDGKILTNFFAYDEAFRGGINVTTIDFDGDGRDEIATGPHWGSPHVQLFQIRTNEVKRLSPGFWAFAQDYRGGIQVAGVDTDGDGNKELLIGVGDSAQPMVKRYNVQEQLLQQFYAFGTNFLGGVMVSGGDVDNDGSEEILVMPRSGGGPNVRIIEAHAQ